MENNTFGTLSKKLSNKKKSTNIYPIIENNLYMTDFARTVTIFNDYIAE